MIRGNRLFSKSADTIVYNSRVSRQHHEAFGFSSACGRVIPNGFATDAFIPSPETRQAIRLQLRVPADALVVGHVARLHPMKDHPGFVRAAVHVAEKHPATHFLMLGRNVREDAPELAGIVPDPLRHRFHMLGERNDVHELMQAMDVSCLSSAWGEGFPNVLGEAMSLGVPCVATDVGDSADIVGETGRIVPPRDEQALACGIMELLELPAKTRRDLGRQARERVEARYALPRIVAEYARLYEELATGRTVRPA
ncbi:MAG: glycosyltransferase [Oceanidesulfovibrio sp.]